MTHFFGATAQRGEIESESAVILDYTKSFACPIKIRVNYPVAGSFHIRVIIKDCGDQVKKKRGRPPPDDPL